ncbi:unnamed protein product [Psylliodes chrysocephalus]|uniref:Uncharacterized protein n=1 Tax=Psylliodes chrysocephalus TaxID=3402493 RepID=A0A9P0GH51_9CUCU|nr:unnamed protein product [Psylliodes chrysocephala]
MVFACIVASTVAQRGSYAGSGPKGIPQLHPRFKETNDGSASSSIPNLGDRSGDFNGNSGNSAYIPVDARGDTKLIDRLNEWPKENRPFWLTNYEIIEKNRGRPGVSSTSNSGSSTSNPGSSLNSGLNQNGRPVTFNTGSSQNDGFDQNSAFTRPSRANGFGSKSDSTNPQNSGSSQPLNNRFGGNNLLESNSKNSFSIMMNGQWRSYVYNAMSDSWVRRH